MSDPGSSIDAIGEGPVFTTIDGLAMACHTIGGRHQLFARRSNTPQKLVVFVELSLGDKVRGSTARAYQIRRTEESVRCYLKIESRDPGSFSVMEDLILSLCRALSVPSHLGTGEMASAWLKRYRRGHAGAGAAMTDQVRTGLYGELYTIENVLLPAGLKMAAILEAWKGPAAGHQDFATSRWLLEVKTSRTQGDCESFWINGMRQLQEKGGTVLLLLHLQFAPADASGDTLNKIVGRLQETMTPPCSKKFQRILTSARYRESDSENETQGFHLSPREVTFYDVLKPVNAKYFPRIVDMRGLQAIKDLKYLVETQALEPFIISRNEAKDVLFPPY